MIGTQLVMAGTLTLAESHENMIKRPSQMNIERFGSTQSTPHGRR
jgi:hypothetical protein